MHHSQAVRKDRPANHQETSYGSQHGQHERHGSLEMNMGSMLMHGMLTAEQMQALAKASGRTFEHPFLTGMIQPHDGALNMIKDLFDAPVTGQDCVLFDFATDIDNTQRAEIATMQGLLQKEKR
ncbi:MAG TPA: DUF305 domain-containing protein [Bryobacteraceae bacterium]|nr:DUF305 domain-containing protein [Bryobacteraceae bacterium]